MTCFKGCQDWCGNVVHYMTDEEVVEATAWAHAVLKDPLCCHGLAEEARDWLRLVGEDE